MGVVFLARRADSEREFAIKVILLQDQDALARFEREIALASRIRHAGIVSVVDAGYAEGRRFYVMEYCAGETLKTILARGALEPIAAARLVRALADAVAAAHEQSVLHRDLKPANIIVGLGGPRVTDFGLARDTLEAARLTKSGVAVGTPAYMSPEQLDALPDVDERTDVYALGVILYQALTGVHPFRGTSVIETTRLVRAGRAPRPEVLNSGVPTALGAIALDAMARDRAARTPSARELRDRLDAAMAMLGKPRKTFGRRRLALAGGALAAVLAGAVALLARREEPPPPPPPPAPAAPAPPPAPPAESAERVLDRALQDLDRNDLAAAAREARELLGRAALPREHAAEAGLILGRALLQSSPDEARSAFEKVATEKEGVRGLLALALLARLDGNEEEAIRLAGQSLERERRPETLVFLARGFVSSYSPEEVVHRVFVENRDDGARASGDALARAAIDHASEATRLRAGSAEALLVHALALDTALDRAAIVPGAASGGGDYGEIDGDLARAIDIAGTNPDPAALTLRARIRWLSGDNDAAKSLLDRAIALEPPVEARLLRSVIREADGESPLAFVELEVDERPREAYALARFYHYFSAGKPLLELVDDAHARKEKALAGARTAPARLERVAAPARPHLERAIALASEGKTLAELRPSLDAAVEAAPLDPVLHLERARIYLGRGDDAEALLSLGKAKEEPATWLLRGRALLRRGDARGARAAFERAASAPGVEGLLGRAGAARAAGEHRAARAFAERATKLAPGDHEAHAAFAGALLSGPSVEADAAFAEVNRAIAIGGQLDAEVIFDAIVALTLRAREVPEQTNDRELAARTRAKLEELCPGARWSADVKLPDAR
jgi:serine/threonine protein kinase